MKQKAFAETIESCLNNFLAQCWQWDDFPEFGSLVEVNSGNQKILGVVTQVQTGSMDPMRYPFAYQKTEKELLSEQPQIFEFLKTTFRVQVVGFEVDNKVFYTLSKTPCKIHAFVQNANTQTIKNFFSKPNYLNLLFAFESQIPNLDELLLALLQHQASNKLLDSQKLDSFCQTFSLLTGNDYRRLKLFLKRIEVIF
jgi:hypothetical protein